VFGQRDTDPVRASAVWLTAAAGRRRAVGGRPPVRADDRHRAVWV